jgi:DNA modification methylase
MPWRLAFALQADGWYLRSDIIWSKPNPMPESCTDRPTKAHEYLFLLTKRAKYYYDADAVREAAVYEGDARHLRFDAAACCPGARPDNGSRGRTGNPTSGRNLRTVWHIPTQAYSGAHFATFPEKLVEPCVKAGTSGKGCCPKCGAGRVRVVDKPQPPISVRTKTRGGHNGDGTGFTVGEERHGSGQKTQDWINANPPRTSGWRPGCECSTNGEPPRRCTVLDPFCGSGTVGVVACQLGRDFIGIDLSAEYLAMAERRIGKALKPSTYVDRTADVDAPLFVSV